MTESPNLFRFLLLLCAVAAVQSNADAPFSSSSSSSSAPSSVLRRSPISRFTNKSKYDEKNRYDFHKHRPIIGAPEDSIYEEETNASDIHVTQAVDQVDFPSQYSSDIILKYKPSRWWLWRQWQGTILQHTLLKVLISMIITAIINHILPNSICGLAPGLGGEPNPACIWNARLKVFDKLWHYQMQLTTFILTFFVGQAYSFWREMYNTGRRIQGRLNDIAILLATNAARHNNEYTQESLDFLTRISRNLRLFSVLMWASQSRQFRVLLTNRGMNQLVERGLMTKQERDTIVQVQNPPTQRHNTILEWIMIQIVEARRTGIIEDRMELHQVLLEKCCELRGTCAGVGDMMDGRMPLAYTHIVQVLVDSFLFAAPLALYVELGILSVICVGMMTLFYEGLLDLAKVFLDPLNNEEYCEGGIDMDLGVLIRESNSGSVRWINGASILPFTITDTGVRPGNATS